MGARPPPEGEGREPQGAARRRVRRGASALVEGQAQRGEMPPVHEALAKQAVEALWKKGDGGASAGKPGRRRSRPPPMRAPRMNGHLAPRPRRGGHLFVHAFVVHYDSIMI